MKVTHAQISKTTHVPLLTSLLLLPLLFFTFPAPLHTPTVGLCPCAFCFSRGHLRQAAAAAALPSPPRTCKGLGGSGSCAFSRQRCRVDVTGRAAAAALVSDVLCVFVHVYCHLAYRHPMLPHWRLSSICVCVCVCGGNKM